MGISPNGGMTGADITVGWVVEGDTTITVSILQSLIESINYSTSTYQKSNLHYTRGTTLKRVTSGGPHLRGLALG